MKRKKIIALFLSIFLATTTFTPYLKATTQTPLEEALRNMLGIGASGVGLFFLITTCFGAYMWLLASDAAILEYVQENQNAWNINRESQFSPQTHRNIFSFITLLTGSISFASFYAALSLFKNTVDANPE